MHADADADRGQRKHAEEDQDLHPANALCVDPDRRRDRACEHEAERDVGIAKLGIHQRTFDKHARGHFPARGLLGRHALDCGHVG